MMEPSNRNSLPGYARFDSKVRISLSSVRSSSEIRELKRKLASELDQVRSLKLKLEAKENQCNKGDKRVGTLARVNSEVSYVGHPDSRVQDHGNVGKKKGFLKGSPGGGKSESMVGKGKVSNSTSNKKLKQGGEVMGFGSRTDGGDKKLFRKCKDLLEKLMKHSYGWVFNTPVDAKKLKLQDYHKIIKRPMDLGTVRSRLAKQWYKSPKGFAEDVRLTFRNAMTYNEKGQDVHAMADVLLKFFEEKWVALMAEMSLGKKFDMGGDASSPLPAKKRAPLRNSVPLESRTLDRTESMTMHMDSSSNAANIATNDGWIPAVKNSETQDSDKRDMTYEEKQRLSADLQNLPSDKLDGFIQIIRRRNPGLFQQEDEIEVDIESFDSDTLWELDSFVTNYKKSLSKNKATAEVAVRATEEARHDVQEHILTSIDAEAPKEPGAVEKIGTPIQGEKHGDNVSRSSNSSSDSGSSSSDSESDSSSGSGSDAGR